MRSEEEILETLKEGRNGDCDAHPVTPGLELSSLSLATQMMQTVYISLPSAAYILYPISYILYPISSLTHICLIHMYL